MSNLPEYPPAEDNCLKIKQLALLGKRSYLLLGDALIDNKNNAYWTAEKVDTFRDFIEMLGVASYSWVTRLIGIAQLIRDVALSEAEVLEIGISKCALLLPSARKGELTEEMIEVAKGIPYSELRAELKGETETTEQEDEVCCPRCGEKLHGLRWIKYARKQKAETASPE